MTEQGTTKEECHVCDTPDGDHLDWCTPQAREQRPSKEMDRQEALRLLGGWAMWSSPNEPDAQLRAAARAVLHDRLAMIRQLEEMRVAAATAAFERAAAEPSKWMDRWAALQLANESTQSIAASTLFCELVAENERLSRPAHEPPAVPVAWLRRFRDGTYDVFHDRPRNSDVSDRKPWRVVPLYERAAPPEAAPTAWMRGHRSYSPGEPDDYDVECVYGDDPPDDSGKWIPLYRRAAQPPGDGHG